MPVSSRSFSASPPEFMAVRSPWFSIVMLFTGSWKPGITPSLSTSTSIDRDVRGGTSYSRLSTSSMRDHESRFP